MKPIFGEGEGVGARGGAGRGGIIKSLKKIRTKEDNKVIEGNPDEIKTVNDVWKFSKNMWSQDPTWYLVEITNK